jgi:hypothetical protein
MDPATHKRYLDYQERHGYFGRNTPLLSMPDFAAADGEHRHLKARDEQRDDEEEARFHELSKLLLRD